MSKQDDHAITVSYSGVFKYPIHIEVRKCKMLALSVKQAVAFRAALDLAISNAINKAYSK